LDYLGRAVTPRAFSSSSQLRTTTMLAGRIRGHLADDGGNGCRRAGAPRSGPSGALRPQPPEPLPVPPHNGVGPHDEHAAAAIRARPGRAEPKRTGPGCEAGAACVRAPRRPPADEARDSRGTARCPRQINPMVRRRTSSAVSMSDRAVQATTSSTRWTGDQFLASHRRIQDPSRDRGR
jgi:hypothetical protein